MIVTVSRGVSRRDTVRDSRRESVRSHAAPTRPVPTDGGTDHCWTPTASHFNRGRVHEEPQREQGGTTSATAREIERRVEVERARRRTERARWLAGGPHRLREFLNAPEQIQRDFLDRLAAQVKAELDLDLLGEDEPLRVPPQRPLAWDRTWSARARAARRPRRKGERDFEAERDALVAFEAREYVAALVGVEAVGAKVPCVLPDHDERTASMQLYPGDGGWYCFGCHRGGGIYDLGAALWGLQTRGREFRELHDRLCEALGVRG